MCCLPHHHPPQLQADVDACTRALAQLDNVLSFLPESKPSLQEAAAVKDSTLAQVAGLLQGRGYGGLVVDAPASSPESARTAPTAPEQAPHGAWQGHLHPQPTSASAGVVSMMEPEPMLPADSATAAPASLEEALGGAFVGHCGVTIRSPITPFYVQRCGFHGRSRAAGAWLSSPERGRPRRATRPGRSSVGTRCPSPAKRNHLLKRSRPNVWQASRCVGQCAAHTVYPMRASFSWWAPT